MSKSQPKEHYVQKRYLKFFSYDHKGHIQIFDKVTKTIRTKESIDNVACEGHFYDIDFENLLKEIKDESKLQTEEKIAVLKHDFDETFTDSYLTKQVEPLFDGVDDLIEQIKKKELNVYSNIDWLATGEIREHISIYMTYQYLRTAAFRDFYINLLISGVEATTIHSNEMCKLIHSRLLFNAPIINEIINAINSGIWIIGQSQNGNVFFTSDNPIHLIDDIDRPPGVFSNVLLATYPLTPYLILMVWSPLTAKRNNFMEYANQIVGIKDELIDWYNKQRVLSAKRFVCCSNSQIEKAPKMSEEIDHLTPYDRRIKFYKV